MRLGYAQVSPAAKLHILRALDEGTIAQGGWVADFENLVAIYTGRAHGVATSSGTTALLVAFLAADQVYGGMRHTDVYLRANTFIATANAALLAGYRYLHFYDEAPPEILHRSMIITTDVLGVPQELPVPAMGARARFGPLIIEDACEAFGSTFANGRPCGSGNHLAACFSFFVTHTVRCGEGGMIVTDDDDFAVACRGLRDHGRTGEAPSYQYEHIGLNAKMTAMSAILGIDALAQIDELISIRQRNAMYLDELLGQSWWQPGVVPHAYPVVYPSEAQRNIALEDLTADGIEARPYFPCLPVDTYLRRYAYDGTSFPVSTDGARHRLYVPVHEGLTADELEHMAGVLRRAMVAA